VTARASAIAAGLVCLAGAAFAQQPAMPPEELAARLAFEAADTDGDGFVSEAELARDTAASFAALDQDHDGYLTPDELGEHDPAAFARVDTDQDGRLSFGEVMANKLAEFRRADTNGDDRLSFEEFLAFEQNAGEKP
jgi:Ca2+-binding EF-hand superfamily protein